MITEVILVIFAILYYLFSVIFLATSMQDVTKKPFEAFGLGLGIVFIAPFAVPMILGIELGEWIKNN